MSWLKNSEMDKSEEALPFKLNVFKPRSDSLSSSSTSKLNLTVGSPVVSGLKMDQQLLSPDGGEAEVEAEDSTGCFNFTGLRSLAPRPIPSELLLASGSPSSSSTLMNQDLFPDATNLMMTELSGDSDLPKRLHVSNLPFRYR